MHLPNPIFESLRPSWDRLDPPAAEALVKKVKDLVHFGGTLDVYLTNLIEISYYLGQSDEWKRMVDLMNATVVVLKKEQEKLPE